MSTLAVNTINSQATNNTITITPSGSYGGTIHMEGTNTDISITGNVAITGNLGIGTTNPATKFGVYGSAAGGITTLTDNTSIVIDMTSNNNFSITLGGSNTFINPTNMTPGQSGIIWVIQDGTGSRAPSWGSYWKFPSNTAPTLTTTANSVDAITYVVRNSTSITAQAILNIGG